MSLMFALTITFGRSTSANYQHACAIVKALGGMVEADGAAQLVITSAALNQSELVELMRLIGLIYQWKTTKIVMGRDEADHDVFGHLAQVCDCHRGWECSVAPQQYCFKTHATEQWPGTTPGCHLLSRLSGVGHSSPNSIQEHWWDCGMVDDKGIFHLDKPRLLEVLCIEAEQKGLFLCPVFQWQRIVDTIRQGFPDVINPQIEHDWTYVYHRGRIVGVMPKPMAENIVRWGFVLPTEGEYGEH